MNLVKFVTAIGIAIISLMSCSNEKSLQRYLVDKQEDDQFLKVDIAASLLEGDNSDFSQEEKEILATVKKINVLAFPLKNDNTANYENEMSTVKEILKQDQYQMLMKMGSNNRGATLKYVGEEDAIDEIIVFASDDDKGFALFRVIGDDMRPDQMMKLMNSIERGDVDVSKLTGIGDIINSFETDDQ
ncbi:MAG: hypothetical protein CMC08_04170 [Flavobacteriaceae bacterium]|nr:hypothetical protein [Flavobacteriaceae bacterium]